MKKIISIFAAVIMLMLSAFSVFADMELQYDGADVIYTGSVYDLAYNGKYLSMPLPPIIFNDRALVPVRELFEAAGAVVTYDEAANKKISISKDGLEVVLHINDNVALINGSKVNIPDGVAPKLINRKGESAKTMVPVRFISENIGLIVDFQGENNLISIKSPDYTGADPVPTASAAQKKPQLSDISYSALSSNQLVVSAVFSGDIEPFECMTLTSPARLVVDVPGAEGGSVSENTPVGKSGVSAVRIGVTAEHTRIVLDCSDLYYYEIVRTADNVIKINVITGGSEKAVTVSYGEYVQRTEKTLKTVSVPSSAPTPSAQPPASQKPSEKPAQTYAPGELIVVLDAGHGGSDPGALGHSEGKNDDSDLVREKDLTLSITKKAAEKLRARGVCVELTRTGDTLPSLSERPAFANELGAALFVSIHINSAAASEGHGIETYYAEENNGDEYGITSKELAECLLKHLIAQTGAANRGVKEAAHAVTRRSDMPASLIECGFISNPEELEKLCSEQYQDKLASAVCDAVCEVLGKIKLPDKNTADNTDQ